MQAQQSLRVSKRMSTGAAREIWQMVRKCTSIVSIYYIKSLPSNLGTDNPENSCYCEGNCQDVRSGLLNVSSCWYDVPVFASYPHFYNADPYYLEAVEGLNPEKDRHEMVVIMEPNTGMLLDIKATLMISLLVEPRPES